VPGDVDLLSRHRRHRRKDGSWDAAEPPAADTQVHQRQYHRLGGV